MTYSASDFADDVFSDLHHAGAITETEYRDEDLNDNPSKQADYAIAGIERLVKAARRLDVILAKYGNLIECQDAEKAREVLEQLDLVKLGANTSEIKEVVPTVVVETNGGVINHVQSTIPIRVVFLDEDTEGGDPENIRKVNDTEVYVMEIELTVEGTQIRNYCDQYAPLYVDDVLKQLDKEGE